MLSDVCSQTMNKLWYSTLFDLSGLRPEHFA